jgi:hypothetical protein
MAPRRSPVRPIHFLLAPRMARRMYLWTSDNPGLTYLPRGVEMGKPLAAQAFSAATGIRAMALAPQGALAGTDFPTASFFSPGILAEMRSAQRSVSDS